MDPMIKQALITIVVDIVALALIVPVIKRLIGKRFDDFDSKREEARTERAETERRKIEQREAERDIILAMARTMLLNNWEKCMDKGYYTVEEREVYHKLWVSYAQDGGNGIIEEIAPRIRELPFEPPKD